MQSYAGLHVADGGIQLEPNLDTRCTESAMDWEKGCELAFGSGSSIAEKREEGVGGDLWNYF